jgi:hypothetical protein
MKKRLLLAAVWSLSLSWPTPALAQLAPPNDIGVALGHIHVAVKDVEVHQSFWTTALGGTLVTNGPLTLIQSNPNQGYVYAPDASIRVEVFGDPSLPGPVGMDHVHLFPPEADIPAMQAWYAKVFGGLPGWRLTAHSGNDVGRFEFETDGISSCCLTSTYSVTTERAQPGPASRATVASRSRNRTARSRTAQSLASYARLLGLGT